MVQCEMCGTETGAPNRIKVEGAELDVCDNCTDFGTEVADKSTTSTSTKYSTGSANAAGSTSGDGSSSGSGARSQRQSAGASTGSSGTTGGSSSRSGGSDIYDDIEELAQDFDERLRDARESAGLSQEELAKQLNEKASLIRKLEHGDTLPTDDLQQKLERKLDVDLSEEAAVEETEWESDSSTGEYTLGDMVERKE